MAVAASAALPVLADRDEDVAGLDDTIPIQIGLRVRAPIGADYKENV